MILTILCMITAFVVMTAVEVMYDSRKSAKVVHPVPHASKE